MTSEGSAIDAHERAAAKARALLGESEKADGPVPAGVGFRLTQLEERTARLIERAGELERRLDALARPETAEPNIRGRCVCGSSMRVNCPVHGDGMTAIRVHPRRYAGLVELWRAVDPVSDALPGIAREALGRLGPAPPIGTEPTDPDGSGHGG